jgi:phage head maturation protease
VRRGDVDAMSFGFRTLRDEWRAGTPPTRVLTDIDVFELSAVCWGAYSASGIAIEQRALDTAAQLTAHVGQELRASELDALGARLTALLQGCP